MSEASSIPKKGDEREDPVTGAKQRWVTFESKAKKDGTVKEVGFWREVGRKRKPKSLRVENKSLDKKTQKRAQKLVDHLRKTLAAAESMLENFAPKQEISAEEQVASE